MDPTTATDDPEPTEAQRLPSVLVFDLETTCLLDEFYSAHSEKQARIVQLGAVLLDADWSEVTAIDLLVDPGVEIPASSIRIHGITNAMAHSYGVDEKCAVGLLARLILLADVVVAHNTAFDVGVAKMAATRAGFTLPVPKATRCTMVSATSVLKLPPSQRMIDAGRGEQFKSPRLEEAARIMLGAEHAGAHNAMVDARMAARVYRKLVELGAWAS